MRTTLTYELAAALVPAMDTPHWEARWRSVRSTLTPRRFLSAAMVALLLAQPSPAQAQWADMVAYGQRGLQYAKDNYHILETKLKWAQDSLNFTNKWFRDAALAYKAYQQTQAMYQRLAGGNVVQAFVRSMPTIDITTDTGGGDTEHITLTPVFRGKTRSGRFQGIHLAGPGISFADLKNLDLSVDRFVVQDQDPYSKMSPREIEEQAVQDAWESWGTAQDAARVNRDDQGVPGETDPYQGLSTEMRQYYSQRGQRLQALAQRALEAYGEDSVAYQLQLQAYRDWMVAIRRGDPKADADRIAQQAAQIDAAAKREIENYATHSVAMATATQRESAARANVYEIHKKYDSDPNSPISGIDQWVQQFGGILNTLSAIGHPEAKGAQDTPSREILGGNLKAQAYQQEQAADTAETLKLQARREMSESQTRLLALAQKKARLLQDPQTRKSLAEAVDEGADMRLKTAQTLGLLDATLLVASVPAGQQVVLPREVAMQVPGAATPDKRDAVIQAGIENAGEGAKNTLSKGVDDAVSGPKLSWGPLRLLALGISRGVASVLGKPFDLTRITGSQS